ncbi:hypothetical protein HELRODRAFT_64273, partial [Helobdella robusta]|uniref:Probable ATP-dependent RNA helicase DDX52 n=1 Tax=Helobdella robusta TaxID=6412 RepID=T1FXS2_HELRO
QVNHFRNEKHIHVYGTDMPDPIESFDQLFKSYQIDKNYMENLTNMGFKVPTPVQMQAITAILHAKVMVCAPTGSGKTLAFGLPILHKLGEHKTGGFRALILAPTRELAKQIQSEIVQVSKGSSLKVRYLLSSKTVENRKKWMNAGYFIVGKFNMVITTPKKFVYVLKKFRSELSLKSVEWLVVDESDKLYEDGDMGFRQQLGNIYKACQSSALRTLLFSATFSKEVELWCQLNLDNLLRIYIGNINAATDTVDQHLVYTGSEDGKIYALRNIFKEYQPPVLVFVQSKQRADELFVELLGDGMNVQAIHSDKSDVQRDGIMKNFLNGSVHILICSDVMARGLDFKNVNLVINYDFPTSAVAYIHRIGRTGRAGRPGKAVTFFTDDDVRYLRSIVNVIRQAGCEVPEYMLRIQKPPRYFFSSFPFLSNVFVSTK